MIYSKPPGFQESVSMFVCFLRPAACIFMMFFIYKKTVPPSYQGAPVSTLCIGARQITGGTAKTTLQFKQKEILGGCPLNILETERKPNKPHSTWQFFTSCYIYIHVYERVYCTYTDTNTYFVYT
jgi:hypothetical protein